MIDPFILLTPILLLGVIALLGFVGCNQVYGLDETQPATPPDPPTNLQASPGDNAVTLTWDPFPGAIEFYVSRAASPPGVVPATYPDTRTVMLSEIPYTDLGVTNGINYHYVVAVKTSHGRSENSNDAEAMPASPFGPFVTSFAQGTTAPPGTGWTGMAIRVGPVGITVHKLGRAFELGLSQTHQMRLVDAATGTDIGTTSVNQGSEALGRFKYGSLAQGVPLSPGGLYYVLSQETSGGDMYYDQDTTVVVRSEASVPNAVYSTAPGLFVPVASAGHSYGPVNIQY